MNIILVPEGIRKGPPASLTHRHLFVIAVMGLVVLPAVLGGVTFRILELLDRTGAAPAAVSAYRQEMLASRAALHQAREEATRHLNALAQRLGSLQAQVLRLNALGQRLTRMAGLDGREFNFETLPAMGGPERTTGTAPAPDLPQTLDKLARDIDRTQERLAALESLLLDKKLTAQVTPAGWPVEGGWVSSGFGIRADPFTGHPSRHEGVDIASRFGGQVYALGDGVVSHAADKSGYGLLVEITHESGLVTRYAHASAALVKVGDRVTRGQAIARVGSSGRSTGPHLHFEVVKNGQTVNPARYLQQAVRP